MIYCVEDDSGIRDLMIYTLNSSGFEAAGVPDGETLYEVLGRGIPQLIILDIMLPGDDGITILKKLKSQPHTADIPVIMATAKGTEYDKVIGLDLGADDYLVKPFGMMEMVSRVKAVLRRVEPRQRPELLRAHGIELNQNDYIVKVSGERVQLTLKEFELLKTFMEHPGHVFTREQLLNKVWGIDYVGESRTVDVHVGTLRTKLKESGEAIETVRGVGYRMEGRA